MPATARDDGPFRAIEPLAMPPRVSVPHIQAAPGARPPSAAASGAGAAIDRLLNPIPDLAGRNQHRFLFDRERDDVAVSIEIVG